MMSIIIKAVNGFDYDRHHSNMPISHAVRTTDMKITKAQSQSNRAHIVATASELFRERGFDGIGRFYPRRLLQALRFQGGLDGGSSR